MQFEWKKGNRYKIPAPLVGIAVKKIEKENGLCQPQDIVDLARPESSELHTLFEWRDDVAGEAYRLTQARKLISSLRVVVKEAGKDEPAFVSIRVTHANADDEDDEQGYVSIRRVLTDDDLRTQHLQAEWAHIKGCILRNNHIPEFEPLRYAINLVEENLAAELTSVAA